MAESFDPYYKWLGIPPKDQPPNHYRLLGVETFESDREVIDSFANRHIEYLQQITDGPHVRDAQKLLNELSAARRCLLDPKKKAKYDKTLKKASPPPPTATPVAKASAVIIPPEPEAEEIPAAVSVAVNASPPDVTPVVPLPSVKKPPKPNPPPTAAARPSAPDFGVQSDKPGGASRIRKPKTAGILPMIIVGVLAVFGIATILGAILLISFLNPSPPEADPNSPGSTDAVGVTDGPTTNTDGSNNSGGELTMNAPNTRWKLLFEDAKDPNAKAMNLSIGKAEFAKSNDAHAGVLNFIAANKSKATVTNKLKSSSFSVSFWLNVSKTAPTATSWDQGTPIIGGAKNEWAITMADDQLTFGSVGESQVLQPVFGNDPFELPIDDWVHCVFIVDRNRSRTRVDFFVNNEGMVPLEFKHSVKQPTSIYIGGGPVNTKRFYDGKIDDIQFFNEAITPQAVADLFDNY